eukprot:GHVS01085065.1.p1 GENE.GHVS01085065.1~~GHVS01085065.1.p1  ORF type:complete len:287 (-),score=79.57 GHVS01085065.1:94-954(-)
MGAKQSSSPSTLSSSPPPPPFQIPHQSLPSSSSSSWTLISSSSCTPASSATPLPASTRHILESFSTRCDSRGKLSREAFHDALESLEEVGLRRLRGTPLGNRLFDLFDTDASGEVDKTEFIKGVSDLMLCGSSSSGSSTGSGECESRRVLLAYRAYDRDRKGFVSQHDVIKLCSDTWINAFRLLGDTLSSPPLSSPRDCQRVIDFSQDNLGELKAAVCRSLQQRQPNTQQVLSSADTTVAVGRAATTTTNEAVVLSLEEFARWAAVDRTIEAGWGQLKVQVGELRV